MAKILLIETATGVCSAAIAVDGKVIALAEEQNSMSHAALLTLQIQACANSAGMDLDELDAVAVSKGPGSYTSLRVGVSVAKGICYALDKPLIAVDTLQSLAYAASIATSGSPFKDRCFVPMLDARRQEVWLSVFDAELKEISPAQPLVITNNSLQMYLETVPGSDPEKEVVLTGNGSKKAETGGLSKGMVLSPVNECSASHLSFLAEHFFQINDFQEVAYFEPFYMKPPNITTPAAPPF